VSSNTWQLVTYLDAAGYRPLVGALRPDGAIVKVPSLESYAGLIDVFHAPVDLRSLLGDWTPADLAPDPDARLLAPLLYPRKLVCAGANYRDHAREMTGTASPEGARPWFFTVPPTTTIIGHGEDIVIPADPAAGVDWEAELAVVIGSQLRHASLAECADAVVGYTILNDVSARGLSRPAVPLTPAMTVDWLASKAIDTFSPMGPGVTPAWLVPDPTALGIKLWINGELKQDGTTADMIFPIPVLLQAISDTLTLERGDVVATGTPAGTGMQRGERLADGDIIDIEIDYLGRLRNRVRAESIVVA
jgi:2,4-diketo-3-deoxy-L-fuconate hydrolase